MNIEEYYGKYGSRITQASERLFIEEFLYPLLQSNIGKIEPQYVFIDSTGKNRRIDFAYHDDENNVKIAFEVNGESYHAEGIIPDEQFDDNLFRQNEILGRGYKLLRFSYNQLQSARWREIVKDSIHNLIAKYASNLLNNYSLEPNQIQNEVLHSLEYVRQVRKWNKGIIIMPTGTGKTILSALDAKRMGGRVLFVVHRLDILTQSIEAYRKVWGNLNEGKLTGEEKYREKECDVLFASKDTLRQSEELAKFTRDYFDYIVIDEVHHSQTLSYQSLLKYFQPKFMLGMTILEDDRKIPDNQDWKPALTALGFKLRQILELALRNINLSFPSKEGDIPSTQMVYQELYYNQFIMNTIQRDKRAKKIVLELFLNVPAVQQMMAFLYHIVRNNTVEKQRIYQDFFSTPFVKRFCEQEGIEPATEEASKRRCPFLLNILNACGIIEINRSDITIKKLMLIPNLVKSIKDEDETLTQARYEAVKAAWPNNANMLDNHNLSIVRELFGSDFLTENYHLTDLDYIEV